MEDSCTILQHMDMSSLAVHDLAPQSFFGVFDGHGGSNASLFLSQELHINVGNALSAISPDLREHMETIRAGTLNDTHPMAEDVDKLVIGALESAFLKTDADLVASPHAQNGSTATTALLLGRRLYCANTGDSRTFICR